MSGRWTTSTMWTAIQRGDTLTALLIDSGWDGDEIRHLAHDRGYGFHRATGRAHHLSKAAPRPVPTTAPPRPVPTPVQEPTMPTPTPAAAASKTVTSAATRDLLAIGLDHDDPRIRRWAQRADEALDKLAAAVEEHDAKAEARADVERLQAELAAARAKLKTGVLVAVKKTSDAKKIRAWAAANGIDCPATGRLPRAVVDAFEAAS